MTSQSATIVTAPPPEGGGPPTPRVHLAYLDGLRAFAVLWVLLGHMTLIGAGDLYPHIMDWKGLATRWVYYVHLAVAIFIVLSGYCLMIPVARRGVLQGGAVTFFLKRARRILPPLYIALIVSIILDLWVHQISFVSKRALLVNVLMLQDLFSDYNTLNGPFWSVAVEWKIYFLFPVLVYSLQRFGRKITLAATAIVGYAVTALFYVNDARHHVGTHWYTTPWYLFLFGLGVCAASFVFAPQRPRLEGGPRKTLVACSAISAVLMALLVWKYPVQQHYLAYIKVWPAYDTCAGVLTAALLVWLGCDEGRRRPVWPARVLSWRPLVLIGTFGYSVYLLHLPLLLVACRVVLPALQLSPRRSAFFLDVVWIPVTLGLSYLFFLACERPFLNTHKRETPAETARDAALSPAP